MIFKNLLVLREIYGRIESELLCCNILSTTLVGLDFEIKPYDRCVSNKLI